MKKFLSAFLAAILLFSTMSVASSAIDTSPKFEPSGEYELINYDPTQYIDVSNIPSSVSQFSFNANDNSTADTPYLLYSYLDANQKAVYDKIKANPTTTTVEVALPEVLSGSCTKFLSTYTLSSDLEKKINAVTIGAISAVSDDNPMIFWISSFNIKYGSDKSPTKNSDGTYTAEINSLKITLVVNSAYKNITNVKNIYNQLQSAVDAVEIKGDTRYAKVRYIHDYICNLVVYDPLLGETGENPTDHEPTSVFLEPHITVCEGYSEAFKLLCDKAGIPCIIIVGNGVTPSGSGGHAWNYVKMDDNKWYAIDSTWDDDDTIGYDYFLVGSSTVPENSSDKSSFSTTHVPTGQRFNFEFYLTYPTLETNKWKATSTAIYSGNGGLSVIPQTTSSVGTTIALTTSVPVRYGYTFLGWSKDKDAVSADYKSGGKYMLTGNDTLYAVWEKIIYTVTYYSQGGSAAPKTQTVDYGKSFTVSSVSPKKFGYQFLGWSTSESSSSVSYQSGKTYSISSNLSLYAVWEMVPILGDINNDRSIGSDDALKVMRSDAGLATLTDDEKSRADANGDGYIDVADAIIILRYDAGLVTALG